MGPRRAVSVISEITQCSAEWVHYGLASYSVCRKNIDEGMTSGVNIKSVGIIGHVIYY